MAYRPYVIWPLTTILSYLPPVLQSQWSFFAQNIPNSLLLHRVPAIPFAYYTLHQALLPAGSCSIMSQFKCHLTCPIKTSHLVAHYPLSCQPVYFLVVICDFLFMFTCYCLSLSPEGKQKSRNLVCLFIAMSRHPIRHSRFSDIC